MTETVLDFLERALDAALVFDPNVVDAPVALLWPDKSRQWMSIVPELARHRRVVRYGEFAPELRQGPSYWLRCVVAATVELDEAPGGVSIIYLPGLSRDDLRTLEAAPADVAPLAALQHRCQWFSHPSGKDWTIRALFTNKQRGLRLSVANDEATAAALVASLRQLIDQPMSRLEAKHLDAGFLHGLLNPDPTRALLNWLDNPTAMRAAVDEGSWNAFVHQSKDDFGFDPEALGEIEGARRLGEREGPWAQAWQRFRESPTDYPGIPALLRQAEPSELVPRNAEAWPTRAELAEDQLRTALASLANSPPVEARNRVMELEEAHRARRGHVWADLGWTPLALALEHVALASRATTAGPSGSTVAAIVDWYASSGWHADRAVLAALDEVDRSADVEAVGAALIAVYRPWLDAGAKALQAAVGPEANAATYVVPPTAEPLKGEVIVFVDGLRLDVAHLLDDQLQGTGLESTLTPALAALPTVTETSKPTLVPIDQKLLGPGSGLDARRAPDGPTAGIAVLRALMAAAHVQCLGPHDIGDPSGSAWTEAGEIDHRGHDMGIRLAHEIDDQVAEIARRIRELIDGGWSRVSVVTDHGWLLLPGGLAKNTDLPVAVTEVKKGRCARIKPGADIAVPTVPWHWDNNVRIAVAPGISCFEANQVYEHGGVSPQECVVPRLTVTRDKTTTMTTAEITKTRWRGLTLVVEFSGFPDGATVDLRTTAGDASSSIAELARITGGEGKVMLLVEDEDLEGREAQLVVVGTDGSLLLQRATTVGQNR